MIRTIIISAVLESAAALWALRWSLRKPNPVFYSVFVGDALLKLAGLSAATWWLWSRHLSYTTPLLTIALAYLLLPLFQIPFLYKAR